jgi:tetratricopeptide (TPR) repeat protein
MSKFGKNISTGISFFVLVATAGMLPGQNPVLRASAQTSALPDHSRAYYHFMLARRFRELAGIFNRNDLVDQAISEYKQAIEADPDSLFLRVELAELYSRVRRVGDAVREGEAVLKVDPDYADAHRLLARIYWQNLSEAQGDKLAKDSLSKAIEHLEAITRVDPADTESWVVLGRLYKLSNQGAKAEEAFKKVLTTDPNSKGALANLVQLYLDQGDNGQAIELLKNIPESDRDPQLLGMLAFAYSQSRDFDNAVATYKKALAQDPENQDLRRAYAETLLGAGKSAAARNELERVLKADPEDGPTYLRMAQIDRQEGRFDQARQELERAKTLQPENLEVLYQQAQLEDTLGNEDKAIQLLQGLVKQSEKPDGQYTLAEANNRAIFLERLGQIYRTQEKFDQALEVFQQIVALGKIQAPRGEALVIETLRLNHQSRKALEKADGAIGKFPEDRALRMLRAELLAEQGRAEEATSQLQSLLSNTPADREIYLAIAQVYSQTKRFADAEAAARKALELAPRLEDQQYALFMLGSIFERQRKYDLAEEQFKKVLSSDPLNAAASNYMGYMLADRGVRLEESVSYIKKALELEPNNGAYLDSLGWAYFKMNRFDLAATDLEKAARLISNDPTIHEHLGHLYLQMGRRDLAQQEWERALKAWPNAVSSDFDAEQAVRLRKQLDELKLHPAKEKSAGAHN